VAKGDKQEQPSNRDGAKIIDQYQQHRQLVGWPCLCYRAGRQQSLAKLAQKTRSLTVLVRTRILNRNMDLPGMELNKRTGLFKKGKKWHCLSKKIAARANKRGIVSNKV